MCEQCGIQGHNKSSCRVPRNRWVTENMFCVTTTNSSNSEILETLHNRNHVETMVDLIREAWADLYPSDDSDSRENYFQRISFSVSFRE